jgi:hypothetical protein
MAHSLKAVENLLKENGVRCFDSIEAVAKFLNSEAISNGAKMDGDGNG